jgi:hypothetical protein
MKPTFTADASLYRSTKSYYRVLTGTQPGAATVQPALRPFRRQGRQLASGGSDLGFIESCLCGQVCDGNGDNCTECFCDPAGCGSC